MYIIIFEGPTNKRLPQSFFNVILIMHVYISSVINISWCTCIHTYIRCPRACDTYVRTHARKYAQARAHEHTHTHSHQHIPTPGTGLHRPCWWLHTVLWPGNVHLKTQTRNLYNMSIRHIYGTSFQLGCFQIIIGLVTRLMCARVTHRFVDML